MINPGVFRRRVLISGFIISAAAFLFFIRLSTLHFSDSISVNSGGRKDVRRGHILDRSGSILAVSVQSDSLFANPEEIINPPETASAISSILGLDQEVIRKKLSLKRRFIWIKRNLDPDTAASIKSLNLKGIYFKKEYRRIYPHRNLASNLIGFTGIDSSGLDGIEYSRNKILMDDSASGDSGLGKNLRLTIDRFVQHSAEKRIEDAVKTSRARQGAISVIEVKTGRILALAKYPNFDPNFYYRYGPQTRRNFTVIDSYEPGSTMKIISAAAVIENNPSIIDKKFLCQGSVDLADVTISCVHAHGNLDYTGIISQSCNVGVISSLRTIKGASLYNTLERFGFGKKSGSEISGESEGILKPVAKWSGISKYSMAIGYEISVTSLQMASAYCTIANGGVHVTPQIIESIETPDGKELTSFYPKSRGRIIDKKIAAGLMALMRRVVTEGTGTRAASVHYETAGKTGTAKKFSISGGYTDRSMSSFIGIAPYNDPEVCILIVIDDSEESLTGGQVAAPVFSSLADSVLPYLGAKKKKIPPAEPVRKLYDPVSVTGSMPDLKGMRLPEAMLWLTEMRKKKKIDYAVSGSGEVFSQTPEKGKPLAEGARVIIYLREN